MCVSQKKRISYFFVVPESALGNGRRTSMLADRLSTVLCDSRFMAAVARSPEIALGTETTLTICMDEFERIPWADRSAALASPDGVLVTASRVVHRGPMGFAVFLEDGQRVDGLASHAIVTVVGASGEESLAHTAVLSAETLRCLRTEGSTPSVAVSGRPPLPRP